MKNKRGFTLIELIVILGLATIVIGVVMSFFIANYRSYNRLNTESELQYQSQYIINFMTDKILEATEYNETEKIFIRDGKEITFRVVGGRLVFKDGTEPEITIGASIAGFDISKSIENPREVLITLELAKDEQEVKAIQTIYMRNSIN